MRLKSAAKIMAPLSSITGKIEIEKIYSNCLLNKADRKLKAKASFKIHVLIVANFFIKSKGFLDILQFIYLYGIIIDKKEG